jgi:hypothetical protein
MSDDSPDSTRPITLDIPHYGVSHVFTTYAAVLAWLTSELEAWGELRSDAEAFEPWSSRILNTYDRLLAAAIAPAAQLSADLTAKEEHAQRNQLMSALGPIKQGAMVPSEGVLGRMVFDSFRDGDDETAFGLLFWQHPDKMLRLPGNDGQGGMLRALVSGAFASRDGEAAAVALDEALAAKRRSWDATFAEIAEAQRDAQSRWETECQDAKVHVVETREEFDAVLANSKDELDALKEAYEVKMVLEAPAKYWDEKRKGHRMQQALYFAAFGAGAAGLMYAVIIEGPELIERAMTPGLGLGALLLFTVPVLTGYWVLRHVARMFVSNLQLGDDAALRSAMAETFQALVRRSDNDVSKEDLSLILKALFRPYRPGGGSDDGPPLPSWLFGRGGEG